MTNETEAPELKPCPFCGGAPYVRKIGNDLTKKRETQIGCKPCVFVMRVGAIRHSHTWTLTTAIKKWNTRADLSDAKDARIAELEAERDALVSRCRMVVSHATAGKTDGVGMSINDVCVQITALRNVLWNSAKKAGAEAAEANLAKAQNSLPKQ